MPDNKMRIEEIINTYVGIREEDIDPLNPTFSCVLCMKKYAKTCDKSPVGLACYECEIMSPEQFSMTYDFNKGAK